MSHPDEDCYPGWLTTSVTFFAGECKGLADVICVSVVLCRERAVWREGEELCSVFENAGLCERQLARARTQPEREKTVSLCYKL